MQPDAVQAVQGFMQSEVGQRDADLALQLIESGLTTQPFNTVVAVLTARRDGLSINAAAKAVSINYRTAQRIVGAADGDGRGDLVTASLSRAGASSSSRTG